MLPDKLMGLLFSEEIYSIFEKYCDMQADLSYDGFTDYFQEEHSSRKARMQDFTPKELTGLVSGTIDLARIRMTKHAIDTMKTLIRSQMIQVHAAEANLEQARQRLKEVMIDRKTHEKLREHAFEAFKQEVAYEENKAVDELVSYTYHKAEE